MTESEEHQMGLKWGEERGKWLKLPCRVVWNHSRICQTEGKEDGPVNLFDQKDILNPLLCGNHYPLFISPFPLGRTKFK